MGSPKDDQTHQEEVMFQVKSQFSNYRTTFVLRTSYKENVWFEWSPPLLDRHVCHWTMRTYPLVGTPRLGVGG